MGCGDKNSTPDESTTTNSTEKKDYVNAENNKEEDNSAFKENNTENKDSLNKESTGNKALINRLF
ncbi:hypothetical protein GNF80_04985 [Clostridium perfringens]|nr:hypothetical protein [Clostridium perfringens]